MGSTGTSRHETEAERRAARLAELVAGLTGCETGGALHAVREHQGERRPDVLGLVARAMIDVDAPPPEGFRLAGFFKDESMFDLDAKRRWDRMHSDEHDLAEDADFTRRLRRLQPQDGHAGTDRAAPH